MPQATAELVARWGGECGIGDDKAIAFLEGRGFKVIRNGCWQRPRRGYEISEEEWSAMEFLCQEWDWGGIIDSPEEVTPPMNGSTNGQR